jgi:hypothetical protein
MAVLAWQRASEPGSVIEHTVAAMGIPLARAPAGGEEAQRITFWAAPGLGTWPVASSLLTAARCQPFSTAHSPIWLGRRSTWLGGHPWP